MDLYSKVGGGEIGGLGARGTGGLRVPPRAASANRVLRGAQNGRARFFCASFRLHSASVTVKQRLTGRLCSGRPDRRGRGGHGGELFAFQRRVSRLQRARDQAPSPLQPPCWRLVTWLMFTRGRRRGRGQLAGG